MILRSAGCARHRATLVDLVDHGERGPLTPAALDHLAICARCERELTGIALTVAALRRTGVDVRSAPVPAVAPERIARLAARVRAPWRWRLQLGSLVASTALAVAILAPRAISGGAGLPSAWTPPLGPDTNATWRFVEARIAAAPDSPPTQSIGNVPPRYPDGLLRPWKEVRPVDDSRRAV